MLHHLKFNGRNWPAETGSTNHDQVFKQHLLLNEIRDKSRPQKSFEPTSQQNSLKGRAAFTYAAVHLVRSFSRQHMKISLKFCATMTF